MRTPSNLLTTVDVPSTYGRVALLSDVHGNLPALEACLADVFAAGVEAVFFLGDLTWGPQPLDVLDRVSEIDIPTGFVAGNAERAAVELARGQRESIGDLGTWIVDAHGTHGIERIAEFAPTLTISTSGMGAFRLCHGSPRADTELLTPATPVERVREATHGMVAAGFAHGHTHLQYKRTVDDLQVIAPGSVGIPYATNGPGARWALISDKVSLHTSPYDIEQAVDAARKVGYPRIDTYERFLRTPPTLDEITSDAEEREFSD